MTRKVERDVAEPAEAGGLHVNETRLWSRPRRLAEVGAIADRSGLRVELEPWHTAPPVPMDPGLRQVLRDALGDAGLPAHKMPSWAGHDEKVLARSMPVGMVFVPSIHGVSHAPGEATSTRDCTVAAEVLYHAVPRADRALAACETKGAGSPWRRPPTP